MLHTIAFIMRISSFLSVLSISQLAYSANDYDVNNDGDVNLVDVLLLQQEVFGLNFAQCPSDNFEPNDVEAAAVFLGNVTDNNNDGSMLDAVHTPSDDEDWYSFSISDIPFNSLDPAVSMNTNELSVCIYYTCDNGVTDINCPIGSTADISAGGKTGCCATDTGDLQILPQCLGSLDDSGDAFVRVLAGTGLASCTPYQMDWHP